jgi:hypothetical protein
MAAGSYWAGLPGSECVAELCKRRDEWFETVQQDGRLATWRRALSENYAGSETKAATGTAGEAEEFTTVKVNHLHSLLEHTVSAIAGQPPNFQPQAANNDSESSGQTVIASGLLEQALSQKGLQGINAKAARMAALLSECYGAPIWDTTLGEDFAVDGQGKIVKTGDVRYKLYDPLSVCRDVTRSTFEGNQWLITRDEVNRWDLIAEHKELTEQIKGVPSVVDEETDRPRISEQFASSSQTDSDVIALWTFYHVKCPAVPNGRQLTWVGDSVILDPQDAMPLQGREIYVYRLSPEEQIGTERGYTTFFDVVAPQSVVNSTFSATLSAINNLGHPVIWTKPGSAGVEEVGKAFTLLKTQEKPETLNLLNLPPEVLAFGDKMIQQSEMISGVNAVRRGNLEATGKLSGAAYALLDSRLLEYLQGLALAHKDWLAKMGTATVWLYQDRATAPFVTRIVGKSNRVQVRKFTGNRGISGPDVRKIDKIQRVEVTLGNPIMRTTSGRMQLAEMMLDRQMFKTPEQFMALVTTGRMEPVTEGPAKEFENIKAENELMADGQMPKVWLYDNHPLHINEHSGVMASPESRGDDKVMEGTLNHIAEHLAAWAAAPLDGLAARGIPPPPAPNRNALTSAGGMAPPAPGGAPPKGKNPQEPGAGPEAQPPPGTGDRPGMPSMPVDPSTGERAPAPPSA